MRTSPHIPILDHLRGAAALSVCLFHFTWGNVQLLPLSDPIRRAGQFGYLGVEVFFVISGFVIPYSLMRRSYTLRDSGDFFIKRLKRLEPPYLVCIVLVLGLNLLSSITPGFRGTNSAISVNQLLAHIAYLNAFLGYAWLNPAFWTLAIEFQYYIFMALVFPLINHRILWIRTASLLLIALFGYCYSQNSSLLLHWLPLFAVGMLSFQVSVGHVKMWQYFVLLAALMSICCATLGVEESAAGLLTSLIIVACGSNQIPAILNPLAMCGTLSYSIYLVHIPIGGRVINLAVRLPESSVLRYCGVLAAFVVSIGIAYLFWRFVEKPSQQWSKAHSSQALTSQGCQNHDRSLVER